MSIIVRSNEPEAAPVAPVEAKDKSVSAQNEQDESQEADASDASGPEEGEELEATEGNDQADEAAEDKKDEPKAKKPGFVKRINKLTKRLAAKEQELQYWREQLTKSQAQKPEELRATEKPKAEGKPQSADFETHEAYVEALTDWKLEQKLKEKDRKAAEEQLKTEEQKQREDFAAKVKSFAKEAPDYHEVIEAVDSIPLSLTVQSAILKHGPELAYELAKDPDRLEDICSMSALDAAEAIGEVRAQMKRSKNDTQVEPKLTKAPKPLTPIASKSAPPRKSIFDADISQREYERLRAEQMRRKNA